MFGGYDDEDDEPQQQQHTGGPGGLFAALAGGAGWGGGMMAPQSHAPPRAYDAYFKAYSVAMLPAKERDYLSYGGKIVMPPSALANLTQLDIESPWSFELRNPSNPAASTHAGVLEFIAQEGVVHLPFWMMKSLRLQEGDPIRLTGARLPKGKFVKLQAQSTMFLEISDPKAVLEQALRNFSTLTQGDIIEIVYNSMVFELLLMEIKPEGPGIDILDTDLEVDFAAPKGYVEPKRPERAPPETMASKLKIDLNSSTPSSSRPASSLGRGSGTATPVGPTEWETFKGAGQTLNGRKTKGKGKSVRKIEEVDKDSKIYRTDKPMIVTNDTLDEDRTAPAPLRLPPGKLFFGFPIVPYKAPEGQGSSSGVTGVVSPAPALPPSFAGTGNTLSGRAPRSTPSSSRPASTVPAPTPAPDSVAPPAVAPSPWSGQGNTLSGGSRSTANKGGGKGKRREEVINIDSD